MSNSSSSKSTQRSRQFHWIILAIYSCLLLFGLELDAQSISSNELYLLASLTRSPDPLGGQLLGLVSGLSGPLDDAGPVLIFSPGATWLTFLRGDAVVEGEGSGAELLELGLAPTWGGDPPAAAPATLCAAVHGVGAASPPLACPKIECIVVSVWTSTVARWKNGMSEFVGQVRSVWNSIVWVWLFGCTFRVRAVALA